MWQASQHSKFHVNASRTGKTLRCKSGLQPILTSFTCLQNTSDNTSHWRTRWSRTPSTLMTNKHTSWIVSEQYSDIMSKKLTWHERNLSSPRSAESSHRVHFALCLTYHISKTKWKGAPLSQACVVPSDALQTSVSLIYSLGVQFSWSSCWPEKLKTSCSQRLSTVFLWLSRDWSEVAPHYPPTPGSLKDNPVKEAGWAVATLYPIGKVGGIRMCHKTNTGQINWLMISKSLIIVYRCYNPTEALLPNCFCCGYP